MIAPVDLRELNWLGKHLRTVCKSPVQNAGATCLHIDYLRKAIAMSKQGGLQASTHGIKITADHNLFFSLKYIYRVPITSTEHHQKDAATVLVQDKIANPLMSGRPRNRLVGMNL